MKYPSAKPTDGSKIRKNKDVWWIPKSTRASIFLRRNFKIKSPRAKSTGYNFILSSLSAKG
jgi:hypothetical protein